MLNLATEMKRALTKCVKMSIFYLGHCSDGDTEWQSNLNDADGILFSPSFDARRAADEDKEHCADEFSDQHSPNVAVLGEFLAAEHRTHFFANGHEVTRGNWVKETRKADEKKRKFSLWKGHSSTGTCYLRALATHWTAEGNHLVAFEAFHDVSCPSLAEPAVAGFRPPERSVFSTPKPYATVVSCHFRSKCPQLINYVWIQHLKFVATSERHFRVV